jgi:hypothetical protein
MNAEIYLPKKHQWLFWIILAAFSTFFAEVFSGSDMFPFFHSWGLLVVVPLYGLHIILLANLVYRASKPHFASLVFAGMLFGLYEAYLTKVLWAPPWGAALNVGGVAPIETLVLVFWWHAWFSFIIPLLVAEKLLTKSSELSLSFPGKIGQFLNSWRGLASVMIFGGLFQSINSPSVGQSLLSGISTTAVLVALVLIWKRVTKDKTYTMEELLPNQKQFKWLLVPTGIMYLAMSILIRPESFPGLGGHLIIWILYGVSFYLLSRSRQTDDIDPEPAVSSLATWENKHWLLLAAIFPLATTVGELILEPISHPLALIFWFGGIIFGLIMFVKAVKLTFPKRSETQHA